MNEDFCRGRGWQRIGGLWWEAFCVVVGFIRALSSGTVEVLTYVFDALELRAAAIGKPRRESRDKDFGKAARL